MKNVKISVRSLVEFILREGDIDNRKTHAADNAMQEGGRLHRKIQRSMGDNYQSEVMLAMTVDCGNDLTISVDGRADGIITTDPDDIRYARFMPQFGTEVYNESSSDPMENKKENTYLSEATLDRTVEMRESTVQTTVESSETQLTDMSATIPLIIIDEIKGTYRHLHKMDAPDNVHLAQAKCYAYIYACQNQLDTIGVQMTYVNMDTEDIRRFVSFYTYEKLERWFMWLIHEYEKWARLEIEWHETRNESISKVNFPFNYRKGQKELITHVYHTIAHQKKLFLEAPTGVGKTIATTFPSVKALGEGKAERIFYLTAKTITRTVADNTFELMREQGLRFKSVILTAKDKICFKEERICNPEYCEYAHGHFDRINEALYAILTECENYNRAKIEEYAIKYQVCPFELSLDISLFCDGIICDYNYLFDPHVYLKRFFADGKKNDNIFLIDEAHNLVDRGRSMYSATLIKEDFLELKKAVKVYDQTMAKRLERCNHELLLLKRECHGLKVLESIEPFIMALQRLYDAMEVYLENHDASPVRDEVLDFFFEVSHFLYIYDIQNDKYVTYDYMLDNGDFGVRLFCIDPSDNLAMCVERGVSSILFSATLLPIQYYKRLLGGNSDDYEVYAESTFDHDKRGLYIAEGVTSKYSERGSEQYQNIARYIHSILSAKKGNYLVFFPSFAFMKSVWEAYECMFHETSVECLMQDDHMKEEEREAFLARFEEENRETLVGFCVLGGIFSEGIDLKNDSLIGAIIVGTGIPLVCQENELIKDYFDRKDDNGMKYAYIYPGFNKVLQAAGRVIRTHEDVGVVALLDYRFKYSSYRELFPREWYNAQTITQNRVQGVLEDFWEKHTGTSGAL